MKKWKDTCSNTYGILEPAFEIHNPPIMTRIKSLFQFKKDFLRILRGKPEHFVQKILQNFISKNLVNP